MRNIFSILLILILTLSSFINTAEARGFSGRGFGGYRSGAFSKFTSNLRTNRSTAWKSPTASKMRGVFRGLLFGGLLDRLFMGNGLASALFSWLIVAAVLSLIIGLLRRKQYSDDEQRR